jgi:hypothetical protein
MTELTRRKFMKKFYFLVMVLILPSVFFSDSGEDVSVGKKWPYYEYNNRISVFSANHILYERIKPNGIYAAVDLWATWAGTTLKNESTTFNHYLAEAEFRMGYNFFFNGRDHITPLLGLGVIKPEADFKSEWGYSRHEHHNSQKHKFKIPAVVYLTGGFNYDHEFNSIFNLGVNLKAIIGGSGSNDFVKWGLVVSGFDVALPITFRFGYKRHWDLRLEPFNIFLIGQDTYVNTFGGRGTFGYRF